jgi:hypothetical protein
MKLKANRQESSCGELADFELNSETGGFAADLRRLIDCWVFKGCGLLAGA